MTDFPDRPDSDDFWLMAEVVQDLDAAAASSVTIALPGMSQRRTTRMPELNDLMEFGHIVLSDGNGNVTDDYTDTMYGPEMAYVYLDADGQMVDNTVEMGGYGDWELLTGFTGQYGYSGPIMHDSEYIGGRLETHIRENAGYYVAVIVDGLTEDVTADENVPVGWALAFKEKGE